jgi:hypothetical protein
VKRIGWEGNVACMAKNRNAYRVSEEKLKEGGHFVDLGAERRILLQQLLATMGEDYQNFLVLDKNKWRDVANTVMNLQVIQNAGNFVTTWGTGCAPCS